VNAAFTPRIVIVAESAALCNAWIVVGSSRMLHSVPGTGSQLIHLNLDLAVPPVSAYEPFSIGLKCHSLIAWAISLHKKCRLS